MGSSAATMGSCAAAAAEWQGVAERDRASCPRHGCGPPARAARQGAQRQRAGHGVSRPARPGRHCQPPGAWRVTATAEWMGQQQDRRPRRRAGLAWGPRVGPSAQAWSPGRAARPWQYRQAARAAKSSAARRGIHPRVSEAPSHRCRVARASSAYPALCRCSNLDPLNHTPLHLFGGSHPEDPKAICQNISNRHQEGETSLGQVHIFFQNKS